MHLVRAARWFSGIRPSLRRLVRSRVLAFRARRQWRAADTSAPRTAAVVDALFADLLRGGKASRDAWRVLLRHLDADGPQTAETLRDIGPDERYYLLVHLLFLIARSALPDHALRTRLFDAGESMGIHFLPAHFYSPVPTIRDLPESTWQPYDLAGVDWRPTAQRDLLKRLSRWTPELTALVGSVDGGAASAFRFDNDAFAPTDAALYYAMIREFRPRRILEIGGGHSTLLSTGAAARNGDAVVDCVEPFPMPILRTKPNHLRRLIELPVQQVPIEEFTSLESGDILFVDCSHVARIGSDVNHLILRVFPHLKSGVIVHVHDIFLPDEYPRQWVTEQKLFWSEQYVLHAFLMFNSCFRVLASAHYLGKHHPDEVVAAFPFCVPPGGGSIWFQRLDQLGTAATSTPDLGLTNS